jgi:hypothetical protein
MKAPTNRPARIPVVQPGQLAQAVVVDPARHVVERVPQEVHVTALICRLRESLAQCRPEAGVIVGDDKLDAVQTVGLQPQEEISAALAIGEVSSQK